MLVANAIAEILKQEGVKFIIGYPVNPIIEAAAEADIRTIIVRQERTGLHMADAVSRLSSGDDIGVFVMQHGPGAENAFGGVAQAFSESVPVLVMPAGYARRLMHYYPNFNSTLNMKHITKWAEPLTMGKALPEVMRRAFWQLRNGRPGPVLVEIPMDVFREEVPDQPYVNSYATRSGPDPVMIEKAADLIAAAEKPVLYAGQGVHYAKAWEPLRILAEQENIPVTTSLEGKSAFPENHPLSLGSGGRSIPRAVHEFVQESDLIIGIGCSFALTAFGLQMPRGKRIIHATLDPMDLNKDVPAECAFTGDAGLVLSALTEALKTRKSPHSEKRKKEAPGRIAAIKRDWLNEWMPKLTDNSAPISPYRVIWDLMQIVDIENTVITHDAGSPRDQITPFWECVTPLSYIGWGKTTQLGYGLGLAMGAKLARPDALCINVWGDAAIGFTGMDFETAVREKLPILSILFNNFSMAIELPIMQVATEKYRSTDISGHYADMAKAFGGYGERVTDPEEIIPAIKRGIEATKNGQAALIEFITQKELATSTY
ncbi:MAG: thiamine pyrophosphate-requiring protein [Gammaproteobacteria bacterium]|nr:thiamine pyrophosphate-requiring protein [Gammaproteobacteria bacterium]